MNVWTELLFMHGHIADPALARRLAGEAGPEPAPMGEPGPPPRERGKAAAAAVAAVACG